MEMNYSKKKHLILIKQRWPHIFPVFFKRRHHDDRRCGQGVSEGDQHDVHLWNHHGHRRRALQPPQEDRTERHAPHWHQSQEVRKCQ